MAIASHLLARDASRVDPEAGDASALRPGWHDGRRRTLFELSASSAGALFLRLAIVPVGRLAAMATEAPFRNLRLVILPSLLVTYSAVFAAGFVGEARRQRTPGPLQTPFAKTVTDYGERVVESAEINMQFLPRQGTQDATFVTTRDPASRALRSRVESLQVP